MYLIYKAKKSVKIVKIKSLKLFAIIRVKIFKLFIFTIFNFLALYIRYMQKPVYALDKLPVIVPFHFFFMTWKHGVGSGLFEKTAFTTALERESRTSVRVAKAQGVPI